MGKQWRVWYPRSWRDRYGEEYEQLLADIQAEHGLTWRGEFDVVRSGLSLHQFFPSHRSRPLVIVGSVVVTSCFGLSLWLGFGASDHNRAALPPNPSAYKCVKVVESTHRGTTRVEMPCASHVSSFRLVVP